jgi:hypothetical protein
VSELHRWAKTTEMKTTDRPFVEWLLVAVLASILSWRVYVDFTRPLVFDADRWMYVVPHLHIYVGLAFACVMIVARTGRKWFPFLLVAACFWVFPVAYVKYGQMVEARDSISLRSLAVKMERRFWTEVARDVAMAMTIATLGVLMIVRKEDTPNQALQTTPMTRSVYDKTIEFGYPQRGV